MTSQKILRTSRGLINLFQQQKSTASKKTCLSKQRWRIKSLPPLQQQLREMKHSITNVTVSKSIPLGQNITVPSLERSMRIPMNTIHSSYPTKKLLGFAFRSILQTSEGIKRNLMDMRFDEVGVSKMQRKTGEARIERQLLLVPIIKTIGNKNIFNSTKLDYLLFEVQPQKTMITTSQC